MNNNIKNNTVHYLQPITTFFVIIKFPYNMQSDWLKQHALSQNRACVDDSKLTFKFLLWSFDKFGLN